MFVLTELEDAVEIRVFSENKESEELNKLNQKYTNKLVEGLGLGLNVQEVLHILEYEIQSEILVATVRFSVLFQRFYPEEICVGKLLKQEEERMVVGDGLFNNYEVSASGLFENCEFESYKDFNRWIWNYKGNQLVFSVDDPVIFRIKAMRFEDGLVEASMDEQGLGPAKWWE